MECSSSIFVRRSKFAWHSLLIYLYMSTVYSSNAWMSCLSKHRGCLRSVKLVGSKACLMMDTKYSCDDSLIYIIFWICASLPFDSITRHMIISNMLTIYPIPSSLQRAIKSTREVSRNLSWTTSKYCSIFYTSCNMLSSLLNHLVALASRFMVKSKSGSLMEVSNL